MHAERRGGTNGYARIEAHPETLRMWLVPYFINIATIEPAMKHAHASVEHGTGIMCKLRIVVELMKRCTRKEQ